ncbi:hypothetical protein [Nostoc sp.]|uniref:hypothetical protein n=1 Tax=Nostoc sp. TaxID=1180 RepID=UPI002FFB6552
MLIYPEDIRDTLAIASGCDDFGNEITFEEMINANAAMVNWLDGTVEYDAYFDALAQANIDPIKHLSPIFNAVRQ